MASQVNPDLSSSQIGNGSEPEGSNTSVNAQTLPVNIGLEFLDREKVDFGILSATDEKILELRKARQSAPKNGDEDLSISVSHEKGEILLPRHMVSDEANIIGLIMLRLAYILEYDVIMFNGDRYHYEEPTKEVRDFFYGFLLGLEDKANLRLTDKTNPVELGRAVTYAVRIRGYFRKDAKLTSASLRANQAFFGNDPQIDAKTKVLKKGMILDKYLKSYLSNQQKDGPSLKKAIVTLIEKLDFGKEFPTEIKVKTINDNVIEMTKLADIHRRIPKGDTRPKKKDSKKATVGKLPEKPTQSPLLTEEELKTINSFLGPLWATLTPLEREWSKSLSSIGHASVKRRIDQSFKTRWECLEALASVTTKRLKEIKSHEGDSKLTKRKVTRSDFDGWYALRPDAKAKWLFELSDILKPIRSLSREQIEMIGYPANLWDQSRKLAAESDTIRVERTSRQHAVPPESIPTFNRYMPLIEDDSDWMESFSNYFSSGKISLSKLRLVGIVQGTKSTIVAFNLTDLTPTLMDFIPSATQHREVVADWLQIPSDKRALEVAKQKHGPSTPIGKLMNTLTSKKLIQFMKTTSVPGVFSGVRTELCGLIDDTLVSEYFQGRSDGASEEDGDGLTAD
jgi:hypothetical protein